MVGVECGVWSVECGVWRVESGVRSVGVYSLVQGTKPNLKTQGTTYLECAVLHNAVLLALDGAYELLQLAPLFAQHAPRFGQLLHAPAPPLAAVHQTHEPAGG